MDRMLAKDPKHRFDNMEQVTEALKEIAHELRSTSPSRLRSARDIGPQKAEGRAVVRPAPSDVSIDQPEAAYPPAPRSRGRRKLAIAGMALVACGAAAMGIFQFVPNRSTTAAAVPTQTSITQASFTQPATTSSRVNAARVQGMIDLAKQRARSIAMSPMLRAAIVTDAATVQDLLRSEPTFAVATGETMELHQGREKTSVLLARVPNDARPIGVGSTRIDLRARLVRVVVTAPVQDRDAHDAGSLVLAVAIPELGPDEVAQTIDALRVADPSIEVLK